MKKCLAKVDWVLGKRSCNQIWLLSMMLTTFIAMIDIAVGYEIAVSIFFLLPIAISAWYCSHRSGVISCILAAIIWLIIDYSLHPYSNPVAPFWNALVRLGFFLIVEGLLNQLKIRLGMEVALARKDSLTGLLNVRGFTEQAEGLFGLAARYNKPIVLAYIDLDNFKKVNDEFGHSEGDKVLQVISDKLLTTLRTTDVVGRLGGDEFAIVLPETDEPGAKARFDTLKSNLLHEVQKHNWPIGFSIGVVTFDTQPSNFNEAIKIADSLMYQVKTRGKNNIIFQHFPTLDKITGQI